VSDSNVLPLVFGDEGMVELARCIEYIVADLTKAVGTAHAAERIDPDAPADPAKAEAWMTRVVGEDGALLRELVRRDAQIVPPEPSAPPSTRTRSRRSVCSSDGKTRCHPLAERIVKHAANAAIRGGQHVLSSVVADIHDPQRDQLVSWRHEPPARQEEIAVAFPRANGVARPILATPRPVVAGLSN
jgi:hypothetical protein